MRWWRLLWLVPLLSLAYGIVLLAALGHNLTATRQDVAAAKSRLAALEAERGQLIGERDAARQEAAAAREVAMHLSGPAAGALAAGPAVEGSATVVVVLAPDRYLARLQPATAEVVLHLAPPSRLRIGQTLGFAGVISPQAGPRGVPTVDVTPVPGPPKP